MPFEFWQIANVVIRSLINLEVAWIAVQLLPMRARGRMILYVLAFVQIPIGWATVGLGLSAFGPVGFVLFYAVMPFLLWRAGRGERFACAVVVLVIVLACEAIAGLVFSLVGLNLFAADEEAPEVMLACRIVYMGLMALLARLAGRLIARARRVGQGGPIGWYGLFFVAQIVILIALWYHVFTLQLIDPNVISGFVLMIAFCFAADTVALVSLERHGTALREQQRIALLESQLSDYLEDSRDLLMGAADAARFRHDWRNHLQVVRELVARGEGDEARAYVSDLRYRLGGTSVAASGAVPRVAPSAALGTACAKDEERA